jgi:hypothetical protein
MLVAPTDPTFIKATGVVTIPAATNYVYKNSDNGNTLSAGAQTALAVGATLNVQAVPSTGFHFANDAEGFWSFFRRA